ncbi:MAG: response regulator [Polyangiaceae bacterium]|nr:response regulator [Polyangiaceae bacterium]MCW5790092.1 response regulator [Polyangiaceae bacterium]
MDEGVAKPEVEDAARAEFVESLSRRLEFIRNLLESLDNSPESGERQASAQRRLHALKAAAQVLAFDGLASAVAKIEGQVSVPISPELGRQLARRLESLPSLVVSGSGQSIEPFASRRPAYPPHALVFGTPPLADSLRSELAFATGQALECDRTDNLSRALSLVVDHGPDVVVVDYDRPSAEELVQRLTGLDRSPPLVVLGHFDSPEAAAKLARAGVTRVLPKPVSPSTLRATVLDVFGRDGARPELPRSLGELTVDQLAERVAEELKAGLAGTVEPTTRGRAVNLGDGAEVRAAVWGAIARIREVMTVRSGGQVRFDPRGPEGAIHVAPWSTGERRAGERSPVGARAADDVSLDGRLILVADDDPAVTWFLSGLLRGAGARVMEAGDGKRALSLCQRFWPDAVVSDILMPELDGFQLCREIKSDIAVRDTPVILLSWKEDMLQRVRELGAEADGYLKKEADGSLIVQRLREVLRPRSRVEARLTQGGEVKGRLGDITPRLVLELASRRMGSCQISIRDAAYLYEVEVRGGRPVAATRTAEDGGSVRGKPVLGSLLGVSAGRFAIRPSEGEVQRDFELDLFMTLEEPIKSARGARRALVGAQLLDVERVALDPGVLDAYMRATPDSARDVARRLAQGISVRQLVQGGAEVSLVEAVLLDLAQHGGVRAVVTARGDDVLPQAAALMAEVTATGEPPPVREISAPQFTLEFESMSPPAAATSAAPTHLVVKRAEAPRLTPEQEEQVDALVSVLSEHPSEAPPDVASGDAKEPSQALPAVSEASEPHPAPVVNDTDEARGSSQTTDGTSVSVSDTDSEEPSDEGAEASSSAPEADARTSSAAPEAPVRDVEESGSPLPVVRIQFAPMVRRKDPATGAPPPVEAAKPATDAPPPVEAAKPATDAPPAIEVASEAPRAADTSTEPGAAAPSAEAVATVPSTEAPNAKPSASTPSAVAPRVEPAPATTVTQTAPPIEVRSTNEAPQAAPTTTVGATPPTKTIAGFPAPKLGGTAPLPEVREIAAPPRQTAEPSRQTAEPSRQTAEPSRPAQEAAPEAALPKAAPRPSSHTAPLPPTKPIAMPPRASEPLAAAPTVTIGARSEPAEAAAESHAARAQSEPTPGVAEPAEREAVDPPGASTAPSSALPNPQNPIQEAAKLAPETQEVTRAPSIESTDKVSITDASAPPTDESSRAPSAAAPTDRAPSVARTPDESSRAPSAAAREEAPSLKALAEEHLAQAKTDTSKETEAAEPRATEAAVKSESLTKLPTSQAVAETSVPQPKEAQPEKPAAEKPAIGLASLERPEPRQLEPKAETSQPEPASAEPATRSIRFDVPRTRRIDRGPMPRLEDETPAALAASEPKKSRGGSRWLRSLGTVGAAGAAAVVAYLGVRSLMAPLTAELPEPPAAAAVDPAEVPSAPAVVPPPAPAPVPEPAAKLQVSYGDAPQDITLDTDKGLLELTTSQRHSIYVDQVFVGRGPRRRVPLGAGRHEVRLKLNTTEIVQEIEVRPGATTLVRLAE